MTACAALVVASLAWPADAGAQRTPRMTPDGYRQASRLGGPTALFKPPLTTLKTFQRMAAGKKMTADLKNVLGQAGIGDTADAVLGTIAGAASAANVGACTPENIPAGTVVECDFGIGSRLEWMALRGKPKREPTLLTKIEWQGKKPFSAFAFKVTQNEKVYTFIVPKLCGNLSLMQVLDIRKEPARLSVSRECVDKKGTLRATVRVTSPEKAQRVRVSINGQPAGELTAPSWSMTSSRPGSYTFEAVDPNGQSYPVEPRSAEVPKCDDTRTKEMVKVTCAVRTSSAKTETGYDITIDASGSSSGDPNVPPTITAEVFNATTGASFKTLTLDASKKAVVAVPKGKGAYRVSIKTSVAGRTAEFDDKFVTYGGEVTCEETIDPYANLVAAEPAVAAAGPFWFFDGTFGKQRRVWPAEVVTPIGGATAAEYGWCTSLFGVSVGFGKRFDNNVEVAGSVGAALTFESEEDGDKSQMYVEGEVNKYFGNDAFVGTGLGVWDLTRGDTVTPSWLFHFGIPVSKGRKPVYFLTEGRLFFDGIDDIQSNYMFWAGVRVKFPTK